MGRPLVYGSMVGGGNPDLPAIGTPEVAAARPAPVPLHAMPPSAGSGAPAEWTLAKANSEARAITAEVCLASIHAEVLCSYHTEAARERTEGTIAPHVAMAMMPAFSAHVMLSLRSALDPTGGDITGSQASYEDVIRPLSIAPGTAVNIPVYAEIRAHAIAALSSRYHEYQTRGAQVVLLFHVSDLIKATCWAFACNAKCVLMAVALAAHARNS